MKSQKKVTSLKFWILVEEELHYPCSENKGADQLRSYCEADLRLCFRICRLLIFPCGGSCIKVTYHNVFSLFQKHKVAVLPGEFDVKYPNIPHNDVITKFGHRIGHLCKHNPTMWLVEHIRKLQFISLLFNCGFIKSQSTILLSSRNGITRRRQFSIPRLRESKQ